MAARAYWQGQIRLALVSIPVEIYPATKSGAAISFRQIHEPTGKPINFEKVVQGVGPVDRDEIVKGFEVSKGNYVLLEDEEIEAVKIESRKTLDLVQFVGRDDIDVLYFEKPYYVVPADDLAEEAYVVLREALRGAGKIALGQLSVRGREQLVSLMPCGRGIVMETLRYSDEVQKAQGFFRDIPDAKPDADLLDLATTLIDKKTAPFRPEEFHAGSASMASCVLIFGWHTSPCSTGLVRCRRTCGGCMRSNDGRKPCGSNDAGSVADQPFHPDACEDDSSVIIGLEETSDRAVGKFRQHAISEASRPEHALPSPRRPIIETDVNGAVAAAHAVWTAVKNRSATRAFVE